MFSIQCQCSARFKLPPDCLGRPAPCPKCKSIMRAISGGGDIGAFDARLVIEAGPTRVGEQFLLAGQGMIKIGKLEGKPIHLEGTLVSRNHCRLVRTPAGNWMIEDAKSTNGLFVNQQKTHAAELRNGDRVGIGEYTLLFRSGPISPKASARPLEQDDMYALAEMEATAPEAAPAPQELAPEVRVVAPGTPTAAAAGPRCPSCQRVWPAGTRICIQCGIDIKTGRAILTSKGVDEDAIAIHADNWVRFISWIIPGGPFPVASEAFGTRRPHAVWAITILTILASLLFMPIACNFVKPTAASLNLALWSGVRDQTPTLFDTPLDDVAKTEQPDSAPVPPSAASPAAAMPAAEDSGEEMADAADTADDADLQPATHYERTVDDSGAVHYRRVTNAERAAAPELAAEEPSPAPTRHQPVDDLDIDDLASILASEAIPPGVTFHWYQPFTSALLHGGLFHLAGNILFLLVFGLRVNELIGSAKTAILYPVLALTAGLTDHLATAHQPMHATLGASGAIMGLAGMYFVFFPLQKVHMIFWIRFLFFFLYYKIFRMGGFWLLFLMVGLNDILPVALGSQDSVAHWAHLGGFTAGVVLALALLITRQVNARGNDLLSVVLGPRAWTLVGKPRLN